MYVCNTNQIGATINNQSNCRLLRRITCVEIERPPLFFYKQKQVFLYWPYSDISNASFAMVEPRTLWMGCKRVQNSIISQKNQSLHTLTCHVGFVLEALLSHCVKFQMKGVLAAQ